MSDETICYAPAAYRYTWPGRNEATVCKEHSEKLHAVASAMGLNLQLIEVHYGVCTQIVAKKDK